MRAKSNSARELILSKIAAAKKGRKGLNYPTPDWERNVYKEIEGSPEDCFKKELAAISGNCTLCRSEEEAFENIKKILAEKNICKLFCRTNEIARQLEKYGIPFSGQEQDFLEMEAGINCCEALVARTGSVLVSSAQEAGRQLNIYPPLHIVLARKSQLVPYVQDGLALIKRKYGDNLPSAITTITGPSRTADIEKTLVLGAHGPKDIWVVLY
jgi:L-lactate dehydrogenase complex protein LldG